MDNDNNFWTFISKRLKAEAALADWRLMLGDGLDFDELQRRFLAPTGKMANLITCPEQCNPSCGFRKVCEWDGKYEAVCKEWPLKSYEIEKADALFFTVKPSGLLPEIVKIFKIIPHIGEFGKEEDTWKLGVVPVPGGKSATVYLTLKVWNHEIMDLIYRLNCEEHRPYILLVTARKIVHGTSEKVLNDMGSTFVPLNEVIDFNTDTEFELLRECNLPQLVAPPDIFSQEQTGRIRKETHNDSDYWFVDAQLKKIYHREKTHSIQSRILNILNDQFGIGWIPHQTFMNAAGWTPDEYFGRDNDSGRMQKQLFLIRRDLGLEIIFSREYGVKLSPAVTSSKSE